jgi:hypothetical protein
VAQILLTLPTQEEAELAKAAESIADEIFRPETPPVVFMDTKTGESWVPTQEEPELAKTVESIDDAIGRPETPPAVFLDLKTGVAWGFLDV